MKDNDKNVFEPVDMKAYKKRFLLRKHEEHEAEQLIKNYVEQPLPKEEGPCPNYEDKE